MSIMITDEQVKELDEMMRGIAYRKKSIIPREYTIDDIVSEFWVVAMNNINAMGSIEKALIAKKCYSRLVDIVRESYKKSLFTMDSSILDRMGNTEDDNCEYGSEFIENDAEDMMSEITIKDILSKFREGTNERKYLEFMIKYYTNVQVDDNPYRGGRIGAMDSYLSKMLGFAGEASGGYRKVRNKVKSMVTLYQLGVDMNMVYGLESLGFRCYDDCIGWKREKLNLGNRTYKTVEFEVYPSKSRYHKYTLTLDHDPIAEFNTVSELEELLRMVRSQAF